MSYPRCKVCGARVRDGETYCGEVCKELDALPDDAVEEAERIAAQYLTKTERRRREEKEKVSA